MKPKEHMNVNTKRKKKNKETNKNKDEITNIDYDSILGDKKGKKISLIDTTNKNVPNVYSMECLNKQRLKEQFKAHGVNMKIHNKYELFKNNNNIQRNRSYHQFEATFNPQKLKEQNSHSNKLNNVCYSINKKHKNKSNNLKSNKKKINNKKIRTTNNKYNNKPIKNPTKTLTRNIISKKNIKLIKPNDNPNNNNNDFYFTFHRGNKLNNNKYINHSNNPNENKTYYGPSSISQVIEQTNKLNELQFNNYNNKDYNIFKSISCKHILPNDNSDNESNNDTNESNNVSPTHQQFKLCKCKRKPKVDSFTHLNNLKYNNKLKHEQIKLNQQKHKEQLLNQYKTLNDQLTNIETVHADLLIKQYFDLF